MTTEHPKRHWHQFRLRTLLIAILVLSLPLSWFAVRLRKRDAGRAVEKLGGYVDYEWMYLVPSGLRATLGDDFFDEVNSVSLAGTRVTNADLQCLKHLGYFSTLNLSHTEITDEGLLHLYRLVHLRTLDLTATNVTREGVKRLQEALPYCEIEHDHRTSQSTPLVSVPSTDAPNRRPDAEPALVLVRRQDGNGKAAEGGGGGD